MHRTDCLILTAADILAGKTGNAEIHYLDGAVTLQHDILGFDIPVDDTVVVGMLQCTQNLFQKVHRVFPAQMPLMVNILVQRDTVDILHDDILVFPGKNSHRIFSQCWDGPAPQ